MRKLLLILLLLFPVLVSAEWRNEEGGNIFGDSDINPMADPMINPMADPMINPLADPDISPMGDPNWDPYTGQKKDSSDY